MAPTPVCPKCHHNPGQVEAFVRRGFWTIQYCEQHGAAEQPPEDKADTAPCPDGGESSLRLVVHFTARLTGGLARLNPAQKEKLRNISKTLKAATKIDAARCIPADVAAAIDAVEAQPTQSNCTALCLKTAIWLRRVAPNLGIAISSFESQCVGVCPSEE